MWSTRFSCPILMKPEFFPTEFRKNNQISNDIRIHPVGVESFDADRRTHMTKLMVAFHYFTKALKRKVEIQL